MLLTTAAWLCLEWIHYLQILIYEFNFAGLTPVRVILINIINIVGNWWVQHRATLGWNWITATLKIKNPKMFYSLLDLFAFFKCVMSWACWSVYSFQIASMSSPARRLENICLPGEVTDVVENSGRGHPFDAIHPFLLFMCFQGERWENIGGIKRN